MKVCKDKFFLIYTRLLINITTCINETHGLFDYGSEAVIKATLSINSEGVLYKAGT